ncbi:IclR family transcriptional regulator C-terminal domain-containing protein [Mycobacterium sp. ITM-2016-00317]|uniref:IclR family transcriptional regulator domain-containing protein n=1 Tax=Mycobacterium sp. ITM-2016-00317 TaxID=2099694 RepID=UPI00287FE031|nr:IclR family transcriptional regulator C-terminal domain-containing protein [Mycobacterium sp. ITM-2016-00317]WNG87677.1 IclR family transcriptional regulator C-terminal domain-containing protein [Mycobacterium sp. ITM-2016-00317]
MVHLRAGHLLVLVLGVPARSGPLLDPAGVLGERSPLAAGASGRIILAYLPETELAGVALDGVTPQQLTAIRERGYETSYGENHPGINGVSVPLLAAHADPTIPPIVLGSMTIAGTSERLPPQAVSRLVRPLLGACRDLSPRLAALLGPNPGATIEALGLERPPGMPPVRRGLSSTTALMGGLRVLGGLAWAEWVCSVTRSSGTRPTALAALAEGLSSELGLLR